MKPLLHLLWILLLVLAASLFVAKTIIDFDTLTISCKRPLTGLLFFATCVAAISEEGYFGIFD
jgi:hypothetical protein